jgi:hypothetical protein
LIPPRPRLALHANSVMNSRRFIRLPRTRRQSRARRGMDMPSALAVNSNLVDCTTGGSAGLMPLRIFRYNCQAADSSRLYWFHSSSSRPPRPIRAGGTRRHRMAGRQSDEVMRPSREEWTGERPGVLLNERRKAASISRSLVALRTMSRCPTARPAVSLRLATLRRPCAGLSAR